ncbi:MAG TPA: TIGR00341 family protein [Spirochaetota bacterium]|nr:TIGR00341 family protein [Spirochaetota bacterium]HPI89914.1 TIGR00341 family protein [Spirochaetota bacterium]HPR49066.1 TIGR00341 family protein [Spirochaetota bacterium]
MAGDFIRKILKIYASENTEISTDINEKTISSREGGNINRKTNKKEKRDSARDDDDNNVRGVIATQTDEIKKMFQHVIEPEERTLKNYLNPGFWKAKQELYRGIKEKEKQDLNVFEVLSEGARPTIEYYILIVLSCIIATTGLLQGSTATIIGAMIVAPLMTPILAFSLGVIWGDGTIIKTSLSSLVKGIMLAIAISSFIAYFIPMPGYSAEILARTKPNLFDVIVALGSGIVGAYGNANKKISNTLVGIAIAVALMPPLCTVGIGIGTFNRQVASGAFVLFAINLVSISLAGAVVFWAMKIHPTLADEGKVMKRALYQIVLSVVVLGAIAIPVGLYMFEGYRESTARQTFQAILLEEMPDTSIFDIRIEKHRDRYFFLLTLSGEKLPEKNSVNMLRERMKRECSGIEDFKIRFIKSSLLVDEVPDNETAR